MTSQWEWFYENVYNQNDPRTSDWFLVSRPGTVFAIVAVYIYFSVSAGPRYMRNKEPYSLRTILIIYNLIQVLFSSYIWYEGLVAAWLAGYSYTCQPIDYSESPPAIRIAELVHLYFICKITELLDTVFFVLRKKQQQITFLHVFHHALMPIVSWLTIRYLSGSHPMLLGLLNSFVHIFMYTYYMLAALGPEIQKYLWWKKYLTLMQMMQFLILSVHSAQVLFTDCPFSKAWSLFISIGTFLFFWMFRSVYIENNIKNNARKANVISHGSPANPKTD